MWLEWLHSSSWLRLAGGRLLLQVPFPSPTRGGPSVASVRPALRRLRTLHAPGGTTSATWPNTGPKKSECWLPRTHCAILLPISLHVEGYQRALPWVPFPYITPADGGPMPPSRGTAGTMGVGDNTLHIVQKSNFFGAARWHAPGTKPPPPPTGRTIVGPNLSHHKVRVLAMGCFPLSRNQKKAQRMHV